jgi:hypothetical protein
VAGVLPGQPMEEFTRRWFMTSRDWQEYGPEQRTNALCDLAGKANAYATFLMLQPDRLNWVKTEWVWF